MCMIAKIEQQKPKHIFNVVTENQIMKNNVKMQ